MSARTKFPPSSSHTSGIEIDTEEAAAIARVSVDGARALLRRAGDVAAAPTADWLTPKQVAALLQISTRSVQRLVAPRAGRNRLLSVRVGGSIRIRRSTLDAYLKVRERAS